jgi:hypothetical protein
MLIMGAFGISADAHNKFRISFEMHNKHMSLFSDPNDYFCTENLVDILQMMPC